MSLFTPEEEKQIDDKYLNLISSCVRCDTAKDKDLIQRAFEFSRKAHRQMRRKSGEPYIFHPLSVAKIVTHEIGLGATSVACSLLHDVVEDTEFTLDEIEHHFGAKIASIISGLTKISGVFDDNSSLQAENFRKMLLTMSDDVRVILIKIADRLHNMRTLDSMPLDKQIKIASETLYLYAPLAHRLGLYAIKTELEDLSLMFRHPKVYYEIRSKLQGNEKKRQTFINKFSMPIIDKLMHEEILFDISGRPKSIYSIWNKMQTKNVPFEEIYDLFAIRIIFDPKPDVPEKLQCWNIYSMITDIYMPKPERIRDWVSTPKANGYEALHATVMGPDGNWVEVQIRTRRMDEIAEKGFAAHYKYKNPSSHESEIDKWLKRIRELLESPHSDALEFLDDFKLNLFATEIFAFTPKGHIKTMPKGSTALDFAYEIHSAVGNKAIGAKVNHRLVPLSTVVNSGDQVEIITSDSGRPKRDWLEGVITAKAKSGIKNALKGETKNRIERGKAILEEKLSELKLKPSSRILQKLLPAYEVSTKEELYSNIGSSIISLIDLKKILKKNTRNRFIRYWELQFSKSSSRDEEKEKVPAPEFERDNVRRVIIGDQEDSKLNDYKIAPCCNPIPGDQVVGHISQSGSMIIHNTECPNAVAMMARMANSMVPVKWKTHKHLSFLARIKVAGIDRFGVYNQITHVICNDLGANIRNINLSSHDGIFDGTLDLYVKDTRDLNNLIMNLMKIKGVDTVNRVENMEELVV